MMRTGLLLATLMMAGVASAQVFESGFEDWTGDMPDGWGGAPVTNIATSAVSQVGDDVHGGDFAVRLENATTSHKRFATEQLNVTDGTSYDVSFWVRGSGDIRVGLFDGRDAGSGYAGYSPYTTVNGGWTHVTRSVTAVMNTSEARFILSIRNTAAPEHLVVDDVSINEAGGIEEVSIYNIQFTADPNGDSPLNGQTVATGGIVTALLPGANDGYFVQSGSGPWSGIYVFDTDNTPAIGDSLTFIATVSEYFGTTELTNLASLVTVSSGNSVQAFDVVTGDVALEPLESVLVRVVSAECTEAPGGANFGKYTLDDGTGPCVVGKVIYTTTPDPSVGDIMTVTGVNYYNFEEYNIQPRFAADIDFGTSIGEANQLEGITVGPNPATDLLTIHLGQAATAQPLYTLTDVQGRTVLSGRFNQATSQLDLGATPAGFYHLTLRSQEMVKTVGVQVVH